MIYGFGPPELLALPQLSKLDEIPESSLPLPNLGGWGGLRQNYILKTLEPLK